MMRTRLLIVAVVLAVGLAGCTRAEPVAADSTIHLARDGGDMLIHDELELRPDGTWTYTNTAGKRFTGKLTEDRTKQVYALVTSDDFAEEMVHPTKGMDCADAPEISLVVGGRKSTYFGCFEEVWPKTAEVVDILQWDITVPNEKS
ncbi:MAG: hypothetical protein HOV79_17775 [Hamadaea sp.]|nr:hypothetical protein [Hamadaea sp.]